VLANKHGGEEGECEINVGMENKRERNVDDIKTGKGREDN
jgi:hypothetical protein